MLPMWGNVAALAVAVIFYTWRTYSQVQFRRERLLRERVAYLLWTLAERADLQRPPVSAN